MKKFSIIALLAFGLLNTACENNDILDDTRVADVTAPSITLSGVTVEKYDATFTINVDQVGNPAIREYGVLLSQNPQPTVENSQAYAAEAGTTSATMTLNLAPATTYYVCAYALTANQIVMSPVQSFETASHKLSKFVGVKTLTGLNGHTGAMDSFQVEITPDPDDATETIAYLSGFSSNAGVSLALPAAKMVFDVEAGTVTLPLLKYAEPQYGAIAYLPFDNDWNPIMEDIQGAAKDGVIQITTLSALIVDGGNSGIMHCAYANVTIK